MKTSSPQLELYWLSGSPHAWRVMLTLEAKKLPYASRLLDASRGELKSAEYLRLNPRGKVPTLRHGDFVLSESVAIMEYLDEAFPQIPLYGRTPHERAQTPERLRRLEPGRVLRRRVDGVDDVVRAREVGQVAFREEAPEADPQEHLDEVLAPDDRDEADAQLRFHCLDVSVRRSIGGRGELRCQTIPDKAF